MKQRVALESEPFNFLLILPVFFFCLFGGFLASISHRWPHLVSYGSELQAHSLSSLCFRLSLTLKDHFYQTHLFEPLRLFTASASHSPSLPFITVSVPEKSGKVRKFHLPARRWFLSRLSPSFSSRIHTRTTTRPDFAFYIPAALTWADQSVIESVVSFLLRCSNLTTASIIFTLLSTWPSLELAIRACQAEPSHNKREAAFRETKDQNKANRSSFSAVKHLFTSSVLCSAHISPFATSQEAILPVCPVPANERQVQLRFVFCFNLRNLCWERKLNLILCLWVLFAAGHRARSDQSSSIFQLSRPKLGNLTEVLRGIFSNEAEKVSRNLWFVFHDVDVRALEVVQRRWPSLAAWVLVTSSCQWWFPPNVTAMNCRLPLSCSWFSQTTLINIWLDLNFGFNRNKSSLSLLIKGWLYFIHWDYFITESRATTLRFKWSSNSLVGLWRWFWVSFFAGLRNHISKNLTEAQLKVRLLGFQSCHHMFQVVHCYLISAIIGLLHLFNRLLPSIMAVLCQKKDFLVFKLF